MNERENAVPLRCRKGHLKLKLLRPSASTLGFKGRNVKVMERMWHIYVLICGLFDSSVSGCDYALSNCPVNRRH
jgi:hypothetical protein